LIVIDHSQIDYFELINDFSFGENQAAVHELFLKTSYACHIIEERRGPPLPKPW